MKKILTFALLVALTGAVAGCGSKEQEPVTGGQPPVTEGTTGDEATTEAGTTEEMTDEDPADVADEDTKDELPGFNDDE